MRPAGELSQQSTFNDEPASLEATNTSTVKTILSSRQLVFDPPKKQPGQTM